jgi:tRNA (mo5U34)-methyltransferase
LIDYGRISAMLHAEGMPAWADCVTGQLRAVLQDQPHGNWASWIQTVQSLPTLGVGSVGLLDGALTLRPDAEPTASMNQSLRAGLMQLRPWRKGPYRFGDIHVDTEWRSDWKWDRLAGKIDDLADRLVLDVGCGNGYHCWRAAMAGARRVIGIDPSVLFLAQFQAVRKLVTPMSPALADRVDLLPLGIEALPGGLCRFDTVFSMGVLYHRRSPIDHLLELRAALRPGGQLVLETLVVEGSASQVFVPPGRYAKMRNVWFIPTPASLETWLQRAGFRDVQTIDVTVTSVAEQRATEWMQFESLADFLDPADSSLTVEGHPAPRRAVILAQA